MAEQLATTSTAADNPTTSAPVTPTAPATPGPQPRAGSIPDGQYENLPPAEQDRYARVRKGPDGGSEWIARDRLPAESADGKPAADGTQPGTVADPNTKYKFGAYEVTEAEFADLLKFKGETELRKAAVPADPSQYKVELPADVVMPPGVTWQFNDADPALEVARKWSHANGLDQAQFSSLLGQYASMEAAKEAAYTTALKREVEALGANATMRITAIETWLNGVVGPDLAKAVKNGLISHKQVQALEAIAKKFASQGAASFRQDGREPGSAPGRVSEEEYSAMTQGQKWAYARSHDQKQFQR